MSAPPRRRRDAAPVADLVAVLMDPILKKKAGMTTGLIAAWPELVGPRLADVTRPEKLQWPAKRRPGEGMEPAVLVVACEASAALRLQHQTTELLDRLNAFFGFRAVERVKIVQKTVKEWRPSRKPETRPLTDAQRAQVQAMVERVEDPKLKQALAEFAASMLGRVRR